MLLLAEKQEQLYAGDFFFHELDSNHRLPAGPLQRIPSDSGKKDHALFVIRAHAILP